MYTRQETGEFDSPPDITMSLLPGGAGALAISVPWSALKLQYPGGNYIVVTGHVTRVSTGERWRFRRDIGISSIRVLATATAPRTVPVGTVFDVTVSVTNPLDEALQNCVITIGGETVTPMVGASKDGDEEVSVGTLNPGQTVSVTRTFKAIREGFGGASAWFRATSLRSGSNGVTVNVNRCPGDMNQDTVVDSDDFLRFVIAYNLFDCDARKMDVRCLGDLNSDGVVDGQDFQLFVLAYNQLLCE